MATSKIDDFEFISLERTDGKSAPPFHGQQSLELLTRPGVDGTGFVRVGVRGEPFQMVSKVDCDDLAEASDLGWQYTELVGSGKVVIVWNGIDFDTAYNTKYVVMAVQPSAIRRLAAAAGGLSTSKGAWLEAIWTLCPVAS